VAVVTVAILKKDPYKVKNPFLQAIKTNLLTGISKNFLALFNNSIGHTSSPCVPAEGGGGTSRIFVRSYA